MTTTTPACCLAIAALALALMGCGGGDSPPRAPSSSFLERGNDILCDVRHDLAGDVLGSMLTGDEPTPADALESILPAYRAMHTRLARLAPPPADADAFATIVTGLEVAIDAAERQPALLLGDEDPFVQVERQMADIGLDGCA